YKTIETNGRIGGYRLEMHEEGNNINILKYPFIEKGKKIPNIKIDNNIAIFALYPNKNCVFYGYNESLLDEITKLKSFFRINKGDVKIGTRIGLTRDGFGKIGTIVLKNKSNEQFKKDLKFLNKNYFNILEIK
ncbi:MAG TPA: hypothetical protein VJ892_00305, partial [Candidatus Absconditabacterales bacterium]|nr:hypothetical protein [Candidatus Absconditabacterales bacterium]